MGSGAPQARPSLRVVDGDARPDPAPRLRQFREKHPDIDIAWKNPWEALIPEPGGARRWVIRYDLHDLLDEVERRLPERAKAQPGSEMT